MSGGGEKTGWKCEACLNCGVIRHDEHASVYDVIHLLDAAHATESDGGCRGALGMVRVWKIPARSPGGEPAAPASASTETEHE